MAPMSGVHCSSGLMRVGAATRQSASHQQGDLANGTSTQSEVGSAKSTLFVPSLTINHMAVAKAFNGRKNTHKKSELSSIFSSCRLEGVVHNSHGNVYVAEVVDIETTKALPGTPRIHKLEIEGREFYTKLYAVCGIHSDGKEGKSRIQWLRSIAGSPVPISTTGEPNKRYKANVEGDGNGLEAIYIFVGDNRVEGQSISILIELVAVEPVSLGSIWCLTRGCSRHTRYSKGFKSRVQFFGILDPAKLGHYVFEIFNVGLLVSHLKSYHGRTYE